MNALRALTDAGLHLRADGNRLIVAPADRLTDRLRVLIRQHKAELLEIARRANGNPLMSAQQASDCHAGGWDDAEIQAFTTRVMLFMRRGANTTDADDLAERLTLRDREADDSRLCLECRHYRPNHCSNHVNAGLRVADLGRDLATTLQRCSGFQSAG